MELIPLSNLQSREYLHPFDAKALQTLQGTKGIDILIKKLYELGLESWLKQQFLGSSLKLTPGTFPEVWDTFEIACQTLDFKPRPQLYVLRELGFDCVTCGIQNTIIVIGTECLDKLTPEELLFVLGREIGHIQSNHVLYQEIGQVLPVLMDAMSAATFGLSGLLSAGLQLALVEWLQTAEYTADRAGLLACQDFTAAMTAMVKIAGLPSRYDPSIALDDFRTQALEFQEMTRKNLLLQFSKYLTQSKGWEVARANQLFKWTDAGEYKAVLERKTAAPPPAASNFCAKCGGKLLPGAKFCTTCGEKVAG